MFVLVRCDDRLIHGQCVVRVIKDFSVQRIVVADDFISTNPTLKKICELAAPAGIQAEVLPVAEVASRAAAYAAAAERVLLLMKSPETAEKLYMQSGDSLPKELNIGPMSSRKNTKKLAFYCHMTEAEIAAAQHLSDAGVRVYLNQVLGQPIVEWANI